MNQHTFEELLKKYLQNNTTKEENKLLDQWAAHETFEKSNYGINSTDVKSAETSILKKLEAGINAEKKRSSKTLSYLAYAAVFLILLLGILYFIKNEISSNKTKESFVNVDKIEGIKLQNTTSKVQSFTLLDGSIVKLSPNSAITYKEDFAKTSRTLYLNGAGEFDVKRNEKLPFYVNSNGITTEVLGTTFIVKDLSKDKMEVSVLSGIVKVYDTSKSQSLDRKNTILEANNRLIVDVNKKIFKKSIVDQPSPILKFEENREFVFKNEDLGVVVHRFKKFYNIEIFILDKELKNCKFTGDLSGFNPLEKIRILCKSVNAQMSLNDEKVLVTGEGCIE